MYVMEKITKWEYYLHLVDFAYNNGYQISLKMSRVEVLYGKRYKVPLSLDHPEDQ